MVMHGDLKDGCTGLSITPGADLEKSQLATLGVHMVSALWMEKNTVGISRKWDEGRGSDSEAGQHCNQALCL